MPEPITPFLRVDFRDDDRGFGIKQSDRRSHLLTIGRTGTGKSTMMARLIRGDLGNTHGVGVLDPHGDLIAVTRRSIPRWRKDVVHFDPADAENRLTFNPIFVSRSEQRHLVVSELMTVFQQIWEKAWGPRLEYILRITLLTLTERPGHTLLRCAARLERPGIQIIGCR
jgi:hypothetical protein